jgi:hypothetical protein
MRGKLQEETEVITLLLTKPAVLIGAFIQSATVEVVREDDGSFDAAGLKKFTRESLRRAVKSDFPVELEISAEADVPSGDVVKAVDLLWSISKDHPMLLVQLRDMTVRFRE